MALLATIVIIIASADFCGHLGLEAARRRFS